MKPKKIFQIVIEGSDEGQMQDLFEEIQNKYNLFDNCVLETMEPQDSIIDYEEGRFKETGNLKVLSKSYFMKVLKEKMGINFTSNLKGLNLLEIDGFQRYMSDDECESLFSQLEESGFGINV